MLVLVMGVALSPRKREAVLRFDPVVSQETVGSFCRRLEISTSSFYRLRATAGVEGFAVAMSPRSRAPKRPASRFGTLAEEAIRVTREALIDEGVEAGPWSIWWRLKQQQLEPLPSRSTIARKLLALGLVEPNPRKRPRASWRRFARARPNELWQLDGIEWRLGEGQLVTIYQVQDDCSRVLPAVLARVGGETALGARSALQAGFQAWGKPASVLTDNSRAFNQHRFGHTSSTEAWLAAQGIRPISGSIKHPQTQGKVERSHQACRGLAGTSPSNHAGRTQRHLGRVPAVLQQRSPTPGPRHWNHPDHGMGQHRQGRPAGPADRPR